MSHRHDDSNYEKCALCGKASELQLSHLTPSFVYKWMKKTAATGRIVDGSPDRRLIQDGPKDRLFCYKCEQILSIYEKYFSETIFKPYHAGKAQFVYNEYLYLFTISIAFRTILNSNLGQLNESEREKIEDAKEYWRECLLEKRAEPGIYDHHILFNQPVTSGVPPEFPKNFNFYHLRAIDGAIVLNSLHNIFSYNLLPSIVLWTCIDPPIHLGWSGTLINTKGELDVDQQRFPESFFSFYLQRCEKVQNNKKEMSIERFEWIKKDIEKNPGRWHRSKSLIALNAELEREKNGKNI